MRTAWLGLIGMLMTAPALAGASCSGTTDLLQVSSWSIEAIDARTNALTVAVTNTADKPIRMIDGSVGFVDALDEEIARYAIDRDANIPAKGVFEDTGQWGPFTFERLLKLRPEEVIAFACVRSVLYEDGSKETFE